MQTYPHTVLVPQGLSRPPVANVRWLHFAVQLVSHGKDQLAFTGFQKQRPIAAFTIARDPQSFFSPEPIANKPWNSNHFRRIL